MDRWFVDPLFHLQFAKGVFRAPNLSGRLLHFADQSPADAQARTVCLFPQPVRSGHAAAPCIGVLDGEARMS